MAKESMKAREVKRAKLVARYAEKRAALKKIIATADVTTEEGAMAAYEAARKLQSIPATPTLSVCTTVARLPVVPRATCVSSAFHVFSSVRWLQAV